MKKNNVLIFSGITLIVIAISIAATKTPDTFDTFPFKEDYLKMEGTLIKHPLLKTTDNLSAKEIIELQDENGLTIWFTRYFYKDICISGICRMAKFWIFWDGSGNYLGYRLYDNEPLTKGDHINFLAIDYLRLDEILSDTSSVLKDLEYDDLFTEIENENQKKSIFEVDGYTRATSPALSDHIVKDAVFTCYTLWHTVYGTSKSEIINILSSRINSAYLKKLFNGSYANKLLGLNFLTQNSKLSLRYEKEILESVNSEKKDVSNLAMSLITNEYLSSKENQIKLVNLLDYSPTPVGYEIIYKLQSIDLVYTDTIALLLDKYRENKINVGTLNLIYQIITSQIDSNKELKINSLIKKKLIEISDSDNAYAVSLTNTILKKL